MHVYVFVCVCVFLKINKKKTMAIKTEKVRRTFNMPQGGETVS